MNDFENSHCRGKNWNGYTFLKAIAHDVCAVFAHMKKTLLAIVKMHKKLNLNNGGMCSMLICHYSIHRYLNAYTTIELVAQMFPAWNLLR